MSRPKTKVYYDVSLLSDDDLYLFNEGSHYTLYNKLGSHATKRKGVKGYYFAVWAPNAAELTVVGDFNEWNTTSHPLRPKGSSGIWEGFLPGISSGSLYKYHIVSRRDHYTVDKADPLAFAAETAPHTASLTSHIDYVWSDGEWMAGRWRKNHVGSPISVYEVHLGSWRRGNDGRYLTYREMAFLLADYVKEAGFSHVELLPVMEHPFFGSWGYQVTGYFAPTARYGKPQDLMFLIDHLHQAGIGVIMDWVPAHFPGDEHGLAYFDGTHLYEHADPKRGFHPDWQSWIFNYGCNEVRSFLISSALYWLDKYHADGLRVDGVASMLYLDYSRKAGQWSPNKNGGRENLEAIDLLKRLNTEIYRRFPDVQTIAEESTAWPMVSHPVHTGGLGFGYKWDMGWMHDTLRYFQLDPIHRRYHHNVLTFRMIYAFSENYVLPLSHDEVVYGKASLLGKMPGDEWHKFANLRLLYTYMFTQPGKKLLFMGGEFGQWHEWRHDETLDWQLLKYDRHRQILDLVSDLNRLYFSSPALHELDAEIGGFEWLAADDAAASVLAYLRRGRAPGAIVLVVLNLTPVLRSGYRIGIPETGSWRVAFSSDDPIYGGSGSLICKGIIQSENAVVNGRPYSISLDLPPLGGIILTLVKGS
ncbi:1,4-alpha-glucan branching protein GlgB [Dehalogenimonas sp. THU2]|uniref:1,4-alpha-glucan branching protein GlgB n=1 Tax=Dehalogenimonas sp. THU2 TaxID=3151121 RepID=UPI0032184C80